MSCLQWRFRSCGSGARPVTTAGTGALKSQGKLGDSGGGMAVAGLQLQGASLDRAQLQGASLVGAVVNATDFSDAFLWRTNWGEIDPAKLGAVQLKRETWNSARPLRDPRWAAYKGLPIPWDDKTYAELRLWMKSIPEGEMREAALKRIETLDCRNPDKDLASCDPAAKPPREVLDWQKKLARASVNDAAYANALAKELRGLVCTSDVNATHVLRGISKGEQFAETGRDAPALVDFIVGEDYVQGPRR